MDSIIFYGNTDMGRVRTNNEDAFIVQNIWDDDHVLAVAIDGVGGYEGGEVAAALARSCIIEYLEKYSNGECRDLLKQAVVYANNAIYKERKEQPQYRNMSCVLTAVLVEEKMRKIHLAHVGDTRLYQYSDGELVKLSHDHSLVGYREEIGELTELEAMRHPQRNVISRDVGSAFLEDGDNDYIEMNTFPLIPKSILLLCSDGLCDMITSDQIKEILGKRKTISDKVDLLIKAANDAGGKDNVTVVLLQARIRSNPTHAKPADEKADDATADDDLELQEDNDKTIDETIGSPQKPRYMLWLAGVLVSFMIGYYCGGFTGDRLFPSVFGHDGDDIMELKHDTTILRGIIRERDSLINELKTASLECDTVAANPL